MKIAIIISIVICLFTAQATSSMSRMDQIVRDVSTQKYDELRESIISQLFTKLNYIREADLEKISKCTPCAVQQLETLYNQYRAIQSQMDHVANHHSELDIFYEVFGFYELWIKYIPTLYLIRLLYEMKIQDRDMIKFALEDLTHLELGKIQRFLFKPHDLVLDMYSVCKATKCHPTWEMKMINIKFVCLQRASEQVLQTNITEPNCKLIERMEQLYSKINPIVTDYQRLKLNDKWKKDVPYQSKDGRTPFVPDNAYWRLVLTSEKAIFMKNWLKRIEQPRTVRMLKENELRNVVILVRYLELFAELWMEQVKIVIQETISRHT